MIFLPENITGGHSYRKRAVKGMDKLEIIKLRCNNCGRELKTENGVLMEDALVASKEWGYFSRKDLQVHSFVLCEECCDRIAASFQIPVTVTEKREVM